MAVCRSNNHGEGFAVYFDRLREVRNGMVLHRFEAKLTGAVGNFNALQAAAPETDWPAFSQEFITRYSLEPSLISTQILPYDNWIRYFDLLRLINSILIDFAQDAWRLSVTAHSNRPWWKVKSARLPCRKRSTRSTSRTPRETWAWQTRCSSIMPKNFPSPACSVTCPTRP